MGSLERNLAVLIDFENIVAGCEKEGLGRLDISLLMNRFKETGRVLVARSYADWGRFARYKQGMMREGISLFELSSHGGNTKNWADIALVVDGMELAYTKEYVDTFVVVSGDSDFSPLIHKLKELNKRVIGCGTRASTSRMIVEACDEFLFYDTLVQDQKPTRARRRSPRAQKITLRAETPREPQKVQLDSQSGATKKHTGRVLELYETLRQQGREPLTADLRRTICDAVVDDVQALEASNQRSTVNRVTQDVLRQLKDAAPNLASRQVRAVLRDMQHSGLLLHPDGQPVRSPMAPFVLTTRDAETLHNTLDHVYVQALHAHGVDVEKEAGAIASLLLGDADSAQRIGELLQGLELSDDEPNEQKAA
jgi:uncharacterized LabA/DUF88 family protein